MSIRSFLTSLTFLFFSLHTPNALALTMKQVSDICESSSSECSDHPMIRAYVGGALDLLATLDDRTDYLGKVYCKDQKELYDLQAIIRYMTSRADQYATDNAMLVFVRYFEEHGGCHP